MNIYLLIDLQTVYFLAALTTLVGAGTVFFLRTLDEHSTSLLTKLSASLAGSAGFIFVATIFLVENTLALGLYLANFGIVFGVICVAEITKRLLGLQPRTGAAVGLICLAAISFFLAYDPERPLLGSAIRHGAEALLGLLFALGLAKIPSSGTPMLKRLLTITSALYGAVGLFELVSIYSTGFVLKSQSATMLFGAPQTFSVAGTSMLTGLFIALLMLTVNAQMANRLRDLLSTDELTRLGSRRSLNELGPRFVARTEQEGNSIAVLMLDIDHFKRVNDRYGHAMGDTILRHCASVMRANLRPNAMLARYGGEEFCALVPVDKMADARIVAERLRTQVMNSPFRFAEFEILSTISVGLALAKADQPLSQAINEADQALYMAKHNGRNQIAVFTDENSTVADKSTAQHPTLETSLPRDPSMVPI
jgi:diguanylate cyclase (GGDEF)-like protein